MADLARLVDDLSALSVIEAAQLSKMLEEKWGVSAAAPVAVAAAGGGGGGCARGGGRTDRVRRDPGRDRRKEDQCDQRGPGDHQPRPQGSQGSRRGRAKPVKEGVNKEEAAKIKKQLEDAGATVEIK